jgi:hypothetical protein
MTLRLEMIPKKEGATHAPQPFPPQPVGGKTFPGAQTERLLPQFVQPGDPALALQVAGYLARQVALHERVVVALERFQPDVLGGVQMEQRLPDGTLADRERRPQLLLARTLATPPIPG